MKTTVALALLCLAAGTSQATQPLRFGVVSIRMQSSAGYLPAPPTHGPVYPGGRFIDHHAGLWTLISFAHPQYVYPEKTIVGLPRWAYGSALFDVECIPEAGTSPDLTQMEQMMDTVLADRFNLRYHVETRRMDVYFMEVARGGVRFVTPSPPGQQSLLLTLSPKVIGRGVSMDYLAARAGTFWLGRPTLNRTGLSGFYDMDPPSPGGPDMGLAAYRNRVARELKEMGFKLVRGNADVPVIVVDHVALPTAN
ncbi:MAG: TIGR03435 family protein [Terriglobales bacterium]